MVANVKLEVVGNRMEIAAGPFRFGPGVPWLELDGTRENLRMAGNAASRRGRTIVWRGRRVELVQEFIRESAARIRVLTVVRATVPGAVALNRVTLFASSKIALGPAPAEVRILEQNAYQGRVRTPRQMVTGSDGLKACDGRMGAFVSQTHTVFYCPVSRAAALLGFETVDRWLPEFSGRMTSGAARSRETGGDNVDGGMTAEKTAETGAAALARVPAFREFTISFDGGDYPLGLGEDLALGDFVIAAGDDPLELLGAHGDRIRARNHFKAPPAPMANWCSWYPHRLGVSEAKVLATALAARGRRLGELGLKYLQVDLGWQKDNLPTYFEANARFGRGLRWLSGELRKESFELGLWVGVSCVAEVHPIVREHPEWLLRDARGRPAVCYRWFWEPFCAVHALDVSHPGAQAWLRENFTELARQGVRYVKWDFAGIVAGGKLRGRHDPRLVNPGAREAVRTAFQIAHAALNSQGEPALMLDCSGCDYAGAGITELSYANMDTGNSGLGWRHLREVYTSYACHLFKQRWSLLQPSCLVVGLPGTLEEARLRATATFMGAGHVDIGDELTTLPEDRWSVLLATLPPNGTPAKPVDLFHPIRTGTLPYLTLVKAKEKKNPEIARRVALEEPQERAPAGASVWVLPVKADWDEWTLVAVFNWTEPPTEPGSGVNLPRRFQIELTRLGLPAGAKRWAYEFWSGQFLGIIPRAALPAGAYRHPGDYTHPIQQSGPGWLDIGFHGPAVKLLVLRKPRPHPWPVGTTFHQSGGRELAGVRWNATTRTLSGRLLRPKGENGQIIIAGLRNGGVKRFSIRATASSTPWSVKA
ncbi:MAG: hypothetical protein JWM88_2530 [Verrucomicrobia bacterium]|nr:hypothetical protein [Verrucomicrobiota bacterium]